ncbi:MAG: Coenzyme F420 hydrogenase/dehydrogenase, beta subunit C-terminal domain [Clostridia bacterium]|nr:Coenzyme F420 hydrogenase/dehydrogenase, beta subunit C-terminal domain [Clostridia bacterium]
MIEIISKENCCGCTACASVCPKDAITMLSDDEGFKFPRIDQEKCVDCGKCSSVCPSHKPFYNKEGKAYALKHNDKDVLKNSTSGGFFTTISDYVLDREGVVYGAAFDQNLVCRHTRATTKDERNKMRGSKYVESDLGDTYKKIKEDLAQGKCVLFTGTPCQTSGLKNYLNGKDENLVCIDLICNGVPSAKVFAQYVKNLNKKAPKKVVDYKFRSKKWSWHVHKESAILADGRDWHSNIHTDSWRTIYYGRFAMRKSCFNCLYTNLTRPGDFTMGDCRGIDKVFSDFSSHEGVSLVFVNTKKGEEIFSKIQENTLCREIDVASIMQPPLQRRLKTNAKREEFIKTCNGGEYKKSLNIVFGKHYAIKYKIKKLLKKN